MNIRSPCEIFSTISSVDASEIAGVGVGVGVGGGVAIAVAVSVAVAAHEHLRNGAAAVTT